MSDVIDPSANINSFVGRGIEREKIFHLDAKVADPKVAGGEREASTKAEASEVEAAAFSLESIVNAVSDTALSFSVEGGLSRVVVAVRAVGSDEIIRQFPPEEFLTVAKFIAAQDVGQLDEDFLKGILFDQYS